MGRLSGLSGLSEPSGGSGLFRLLKLGSPLSLALSLIFLIGFLIGSASALNLSVVQEGERLKITTDEPVLFTIRFNNGVPIFASGTEVYFKPGVAGTIEVEAEGKNEVVVEEIEFIPPKSTKVSPMPTIHYWWSGVVRLPYGHFVKESESGDKYKIEWRTALGALEMAARKGGFDYSVKTTDWGPFVKCIAGKCEESEGPFSGWMYQVNEETPSVGAHEYAVKEYDEVIWFFARNMDTTPATSSKVIRIFVFYNNSVLEEGLNGALNESLNESLNNSLNGTRNESVLTSEEVSAPPFPLYPHDPRIVNALRYLKSLQHGNGGFANPGEEPSLSKTSWAVMAMIAARQNPEWWKEGNSSAMDYMERELPNQLKLMGTADFARMILALYAAGKDPKSFAGIDLVELLRSKIKDNGQIGDFTYTTIWGLMALSVSGENTSKTVEWLVSQQNADGGFGWAPGEPSDYDDTAAAIQALVAANMSCDSEVIGKALDYLRTGQNPDGGFRYFGNSSSNAASDSWAIQAIVACNMDPMEWKKGNKSVVEHLLSLQQPDGSFNYTAFQKSNPGYMTASAIMALLGKPFPIKPSRYVSLNESLKPSTPSQTPTPAPTPVLQTPSPTPEEIKKAETTPTPEKISGKTSEKTSGAEAPKIPGFEMFVGMICLLASLILWRRI